MIRPPFKKFVKGCAFFPIQLGDFCLVGEGCVMNAATVGNFVRFGSNSYIGRRCVIKDCVIIDSGAVVQDDTVMPPFTRWAGCPARIVEELPESLGYVLSEDSQEYYDKFIAVGPAAAGGWGGAVRKISAVALMRRPSMAAVQGPPAGAAAPAVSQVQEDPQT